MYTPQSDIRVPPQRFRPRVTLQIPPQIYREDSIQQQQNQSPYYVPNTAATSVPSQHDVNPFVNALYGHRASEFMFKQFEGINRFTKSGFSFGEKCAIWLHTKFRTWTHKWFTHIFLFVVVTLYSVFGALLFMAIEGTPEKQFLEDVKEGRAKLGIKARELAADKEMSQDNERWEGEFRKELMEYEGLLYNAFSNGQFDKAEFKQTWTFFNAMFYCGTIYTTIGE